MQRLRLRLLVGLGAVCIVAGLLWGVIKVGVPYPDPTPEQAAAERFHMAVYSTLVSVGIVLLLVAGVLAVLRRLTRKSGAQAREDRHGRS